MPIYAWPDVVTERSFPIYLLCGKSGVPHKLHPLGNMIPEINLDASAVASCYVGERGKEDYRNLTSYICNANKGTTKPSPCSTESSMRRSIRKVKMDLMPSLYTEVTSKSKMSQIRQYTLN
ncbi:uncharacterized protein [Primulina eburnea]|uniref:uncharacterized protein n=1 Tax=Primulina eburnea TaxID=1245227 RepID=UPI003C6BDF94